MGHARAILAIEDPKIQLKVYKRILDEGLSVRAVEQMIRQMAEKDNSEKEPSPKPANPYSGLATDLSKVFDIPVKIVRNKAGKGSVSFSFASDDELTRLVQLFDQLRK